MAGTSEVLQEYLVSLGFKTDAISLKKFEDGLGATSKKILSVGSAVTTMVVAVEAAAAAFAYSMRETYFAAELSNTSVKNLKAMEYAGKQFGISADAMASSIHNMAQAMRLNPGLQGLIESFGVKVTGRDVSDVMLDFVKATKDMPEFAGAQYAAMFGISADDYHQMINHIDEIQKKKAEMLAMYKEGGVDPDKAKETMLMYSAAIDKLEAQMSVLGQAALTSLAPVFKQTTSWLSDLTNGLTYFFNSLPKVGEAAGSTVYHLLHQGEGKSPIEKATKYLQNLTGDKLYKLLHPGEVSAPAAASQPHNTPAISPNAGLPRNARNNNPGNIRYGQFARNAGAIGQDEKGFAIFPNMSAGFAASEQLLLGYGKKGLNTVSGIIGKWAPASENDVAAYSNFVAKKMGVAPGQALNMNDPEIRKQLSRNMARFEGLPPQYLANADNARLGSGGVNGPVQLNQTNQFNITGTNAQDIGKAVAGEQKRVQGDMIRNFRPGVV